MWSTSCTIRTPVTAADTIRYEPPAVGLRCGSGIRCASGSKVNDTTDVDNGYTAELMIKLDSLGYGPTARGVQLSLVVFDPDGYQHPMNSYDTTAGSFYKSWWGSEWGGVYRVVAFDNLTGTSLRDDRTGSRPQSLCVRIIPNPFNPSTIIRLTFRRQARSGLSVYDVTGREVTTLVQGEYAAGIVLHDA